MKQAAKLKAAGRRSPEPASLVPSAAATAARVTIPLAVGAWFILALIHYPNRHPLPIDAILGVTVAPLLSLTLRGLLFPWGPAALAFAALILLLASAAALGSGILRFAGLAGSSRGERGLYSLLLGLGAFALMAQAAGLLGFYSTGSYVSLCALSLGLAAPRLPALLREGPGRARSLLAQVPERAGKVEGWLWAGLAAAALVQVLTLLSGFTPPHISDELNTRVGFPSWYLWSGRIILQPGNFFNAMPQFDSMLFGLPLSFGLLLGVKWIHWALGILAAWGIYLAMRPRSHAARWAVLLVFLTLPSAWILAGRAFNDMMVVAYAAGAVAAVSQGRGLARTVLGGVFTGLAASNKYTGVLTGLMLVPFLGLRLRPLAVAAATSLLVVSPWLIRSFIWLGNPVYPYFYGLLGGLGWDGHQDWRFRKELAQGDPTAKDRLKQVWYFFWQAPIYNVGSWHDGNTGPLLLMAVPLLFVHATALEGLAMLAVFLPVAWAGPGIRYMLPLLPLAFPIMARGLEGYLASRRLGRLLPWVVAAGAWFAALEILPSGFSHCDDPVPFVLGQASRDQYLDRMLYPDMYYPYSHSRAVAGVERNTPPSAKIMILGGYGGGFYFPRRTVFTTLEPRPLALSWARESYDPMELRKRFREAGITHVLVNRFQCAIFYDYWKVWDWKDDGRELRVWTDFWNAYARPRWHFWDHYALYELADRPIRQAPLLIPGFEEESTRLVLTLNRKKEYGTAYGFLGFLLKLYPHNPTLWLRLAEVLVSRGESTSARQCCDQIGRLAPRSASQDLCQAELLIGKKRYQEALPLIERAVGRMAYDPQAWLDLYAVYMAAGDRKHALQVARYYNVLREYRPFR